MWNVHWRRKTGEHWVFDFRIWFSAEYEFSTGYTIIVLLLLLLLLRSLSSKAIGFFFCSVLPRIQSIYLCGHPNCFAKYRNKKNHSETKTRKKCALKHHFSIVRVRPSSICTTQTEISIVRVCFFFIHLHCFTNRSCCMPVFFFFLHFDSSMLMHLIFLFVVAYFAFPANELYVTVE